MLIDSAIEQAFKRPKQFELEWGRVSQTRYSKLIAGAGDMIENRF